jgi:hypothetical protein
MRWIAIIGLFVVVGCDRAPVSQSGAESIAEDMADAEASRLETRIDELQSKVNDLEGIAEEAKSRADEAHDLASNAKSKADEACEPYGYQPGCGNDR